MNKQTYSIIALVSNLNLGLQRKREREREREKNNHSSVDNIKPFSGTLSPLGITRTLFKNCKILC